MKKYSIHIVTDKYAGNFEREMCAFITGELGDCGVGSKNISNKLDYSIFKDLLRQESEEGCYRPVTTFGDNTVEIFFNNKPSKDILNIVKERAKLFDSNIKIIDTYINETVTTFNRLDYTNE